MARAFNDLQCERVLKRLRIRLSSDDSFVCPLMDPLIDDFLQREGRGQFRSRSLSVPAVLRIPFLGTRLFLLLNDVAVLDLPGVVPPSLLSPPPSSICRILFFPWAGLTQKLRLVSLASGFPFWAGNLGRFFFRYEEWGIVFRFPDFVGLFSTFYGRFSLGLWQDFFPSYKEPHPAGSLFLCTLAFRFFFYSSFLRIPSSPVK